MSFSHPHTCPDINNAIDSFKEVSKQYLSDILSDACPLLDGKAKEEIVKQYADYLLDDTINFFEDVRKTNSDIRDEAEKQIEDIERENNNLKEEIKDLQQEIDEKDREIDSLENQINTVYGE